jgi:tetratricopeptide (TPR) repeat protein
MSQRMLVWMLLAVLALSLGYAAYDLRQKSVRATVEPGDAGAAPSTVQWFLEPPPGWSAEKLRDMGALNEEIARNPGDAKFLVWRSMLHAEAKDHEAALRDIEEAQKLEDSHRYYFLYMRHDQLDKLGRTDEALADVLEAIRLAPQGFEYQRFAADIYRRKGDVDAGVAVFDESVRRMPDNYFVLAERAKFLAEVGRYEPALRDISASIEGEPSEFQRQMRTFERMQILTAMRRFDDALEDADRMVDEFPDRVLAYGMRAEIHEAMGDHEAARRDEREKMKHANSIR